MAPPIEARATPIVTDARPSMGGAVSYTTGAPALGADHGDAGRGTALAVKQWQQTTEGGPTTPVLTNREA
jgi:hypothetical protein